MAKEKGVSSLEVKGLLAHTNLVTTEKYMGDLDTQKTDAALIKVFEKEDEADKVVEQLKGMRPEVLEEVLARLRSK